jgi:psp operon transcriptional activator
MQQQNLIGQSQRFLDTLDKVSKVAPIERPILVIGARGSGKELIAQRLHYLSKRWDKSLVSLNCSTLSEGLIDSELFGHESGSFSGSKGRHQGRFERAEGGTLFLDELATAPLSVQEKLLRVIEYGEYERVGGSKTLTADVRLVCATNANLPELVEQGKFRADLLDRLAFDVINVPSLSQRQEDILMLAEHFAVKMCRELEIPLFAGFSQQAQHELINYPWPGNVRELKNVVERAVYQNPYSEYPIDDILFNPFVSDTLQPSITNEQKTVVEPQSDKSQIETPLLSLPLDYKQWLKDQDIFIINKALEESRHNQKQAAELLGLSYHQLRGMIRKYNIN